MRLKELAEFQQKYHHLETTKMTKKSLCDLVIPFRDKYGLSDGQALRVARREFSLSQIEELMKNPKQTNADKIRAMSDNELSEFLWQFDIEEVAREEEHWLTRRKLTEWLMQPVED